jgi:hypothetical protein
MARPKPSPPNRRIVEDSPCSKALKIRGSASASMRMPGRRSRRRVAADVGGLLDQRMDIDHLPVQRELAPGDPGHVEQVVDQAGLQLDASADHLQRRAELFGNRRDLVEHRRDAGEHGGQRGSKLVAEDGKELVLRLFGPFGLAAGRLLGAEEPGALPLGLVALDDQGDDVGG